MSAGSQARRTASRRSVICQRSRAASVRGMESSRSFSVEGREIPSRLRSRSSGALTQAVMSSSTGRSGTTPTGAATGASGASRNSTTPTRVARRACAAARAPRSKLHGPSVPSRRGINAGSDQACRGWSTVIARLAFWVSSSRRTDASTRSSSSATGTIGGRAALVRMSWPVLNTSRRSPAASTASRSWARCSLRGSRSPTQGTAATRSSEAGRLPEPVSSSRPSRQMTWWGTPR